MRDTSSDAIWPYRDAALFIKLFLTRIPHNLWFKGCPRRSMAEKIYDWRAITAPTKRISSWRHTKDIIIGDAPLFTPSRQIYDITSTLLPRSVSSRNANMIAERADLSQQSYHLFYHQLSIDRQIDNNFLALYSVRQPKESTHTGHANNTKTTHFLKRVFLIAQTGK